MIVDAHLEVLAFKRASNNFVSKINPLGRRLHPALIIIAMLVLFYFAPRQTQADGPPADDRPIVMCQTFAPSRVVEDKAGRKTVSSYFSIYREIWIANS